MIRRSGAARGLQWGIVSLLAAFALVAVTSDPADAARKRKKTAKSHSNASTYRPPFAAFVIDANSGAVLHQDSADAARHPASLTKIMTLYLLFERLEAGKIKLDTPLAVSARAAGQAPSKLGLKPGQTISVEDAIKALVTKSANDIAVVIAESLANSEEEFARLMTQKARALGMTRTVYRNASGLPDPEQITTAREQALLGRAVQDRFPRYYRYFATHVFNYNGRAMSNHNKLLNVAGVDGIKTGYTHASGFNLVSSMRRGGRHIVAVVLGGSSGKARDAHMRGLVGKYIELASAKRTAPMIAEAEPARQAAKFTVATAPLPAPVPDPSPTAALAPAIPAVAAAATAPPPGSTEPIRPVTVKTISVKAGTPSEGSTAATQISAPAAPQTASEPVPAPVQVASAEQGSAGPVAALPAKATVSQPPPMPKAHPRNGWVVQVGAFEDESEAKQRLNSAQIRAKSLLGAADAFTEKVVKGDKAFYRARFAGLDKETAEAACKYLKRNDIACMALKN
jgi:D-alanyl-D-alanine carboxypeptidase